MFLAVDVGNTHVKLGLFRQGRLIGTRRLGTRVAGTADEIELALEGALGLSGERLSEVRNVALASVVPRWTDGLEEVATRRALPLIVARHETVPMPLRVSSPSELGADRLVNAFAAHRLCGAPAIVVDVGTATTLDVVAADGAYLGGVIAPGPRLALDALAAGTALLARVPLAAPAQVIGRDTRSAIQSGVVVGQVELIRGLLRRIIQELAAGSEAPPNVSTILTGGHAGAGWLRAVGVDVIEPHLTLRGLSLLADDAAAKTGGAR